MKKIWMMLLLISTVFAFAACSEDDDKVPVNPVPGATTNSPVKIGETLQVTGKGFVEGAQFYFKNEEWESEAFDANVTASGASLIVPLSIQPGEYTLMLKQDGDWEIGKVTLNKADIPVQGFINPTTAFIGKTMIIPGAGFNNTSEVYLQQEGSEAIKLTTAEDFSAGLICEIPSDLEAGSYTVIFKQDGGEWTLENELVVEKAPKKLVRVSKSMDFSMMDDMGIMEIASFEITWKNDEPIKLAIYNFFNEIQCTYDLQTTNGQIIGTTEDEDVIVTQFTLTTDGNRIQQTIATGKSGTIRTREWQYTDEGYLTSLNDENYSSPRVMYEYQESNLTKVCLEEWKIFSYLNKQEYNRHGIEWAACYNALENTNYPDWCFAVLTNMSGKRSVYLPENETEDEVEFKYTLDNDNYLLKVEWEDPMMGVAVFVDFEYEE